ncbi:MAG: hypothetical protein HZB61_12375 [Nitrospirae bacterium]|nr:hypothetical protein [Nitrospirota bacterium]
MQLTEDKVPAYEVVKEKIEQIDNTIVIARVFFMFDTFTYRFQLFKKDKMCMVELPKKLLDTVKNDGTAPQLQLMNILNVYIESSECWNELAK